MTQTLPAEYPARTVIDVAFWLLERGASERALPDLVRLQYLLYLAHVDYQARHDAPLMPAAFVVRGGHVVEPNVDRILRAGITVPWSPEIDPPAVAFLVDLWRRYAALPLGGLQRLAQRSQVSQSPARQPQAPAPVRREETPKRPASPPPVRNNGAVEMKPLPAGEDVRFTADGRAVTRWKPRRRVEELAKAKS